MDKLYRKDPISFKFNSISFRFGDRTFQQVHKGRIFIVHPRMYDFEGYYRHECQLFLLKCRPLIVDSNLMSAWS